MPIDNIQSLKPTFTSPITDFFSKSGDSREVNVDYTGDELILFTSRTGDTNCIHDPVFMDLYSKAKGGKYPTKPIVPGLLIFRDFIAMASQYNRGQVPIFGSIDFSATYSDMPVGNKVHVSSGGKQRVGIEMKLDATLQDNPSTDARFFLVDEGSTGFARRRPKTFELQADERDKFDYVESSIRNNYRDDAKHRYGNLSDTLLGLQYAIMCSGGALMRTHDHLDSSFISYEGFETDAQALDSMRAFCKKKKRNPAFDSVNYRVTSEFADLQNAFNNTGFVYNLTTIRSLERGRYSVGLNVLDKASGRRVLEINYGVKPIRSMMVADLSVRVQENIAALDAE